MPELPEVEVIVKGLKKKVLNRTFFDVWTDAPKIFKKPKTFSDFKKTIKGKKIKNVWRRGKNIIFDLSSGFSLLIHQKLTGHLLVGRWQMRKGKWKSLIKGPLEEKINLYIHAIFWFDGGLMMALSDLRKFAKVELWQRDDLVKELEKIGPEPLDKNFNYEKFKNILRGRKGRIKQVLMNQAIIAGLGNIYSDEALWRAKIHPLKDVSKLSEKEIKKLYSVIKKVLRKGIKLGGESISDFRNIEGKRGFFDKERIVYQREGGKCQRCGAIIRRLKIAGRSSHFCPFCQKL